MLMLLIMNGFYWIESIAEKDLHVLGLKESSGSKEGSKESFYVKFV